MAERILEVTNLQTSFYTHLGEVEAVRDVSFTMDKGDILGIVGESGSGKSVTALSIMGIIDYPGRIKGGQIIFNQIDVTNYSNRQMNELRGKEMSMIFQDPMTSLNPVYTIRNQMVEVIRRHQKVTKKVAVEKAVEMLNLVGIPEPEHRINSYPHQFSGGMRQRVMVATALSCSPKLLIADEPTTALDVTIQAQILDLMRKVTQELDTSIIIITHDLGVIAETCKNVLVMYGGKLMERGTVLEIFHNPQHPYTAGLMQSVPRMDKRSRERLVPIPGTPPNLLDPPSGCPFSPRCPHAMQVCRDETPPVFKESDSHSSVCWLHHADAPAVDGYSKGCEIIG